MIINIQNLSIMTASFNISFLGSPEVATGNGRGKKGYRSSNYNTYIVHVYVFDEVEFEQYEIEAYSPSEARDLAQEMAEAAGHQVDYVNIYTIL